MMSPLIYSTLYLFIVSVLTIFVGWGYAKRQNYIVNSTPSINLTGGWIVAIFMTLFIGLRPVHKVFVDMVNYREVYDAYLYNDFSFELWRENILFDNLFLYLSANAFDITVFFFLIAVIYFVGTYIAMIKMFKNDALYAYLAFLAAFSTFSYGTNGIKAGAAATLFILALAYNRKIIISILLLAASLGFHHSMILPIGAYICCYFYRNSRAYLIFWILSLIIAALHISYFQNLLGGMADERGATEYLSELSDWGGKTGFRLDFILYSAVPIAVGYYALIIKKLQSKEYKLIYNIYVFTNAVWMLCMYANFTNRIAYLSWFLYPIVLVYPFFKEEFIPRQYITLNKVVAFQLIFTLAMNFIYYA